MLISFERGPGLRSSLAAFPRHLTGATVSAGVVAALFGNTGPALIIMDAAARGHLTTERAVSWLFSVYLTGGVISLLMALYYRQPIAGAWSIPGAVLMGDSIARFPYPDVVGAYVAAGGLVLLLGLTGMVGRVMRWLPAPIVMGMIAGALVRFAVDIVRAAHEAPLIVLMSVLAYLLTQRVSRQLPAAVAALVVGAAVAFLTGGFQSVAADARYIGPSLVVPTFSSTAFIGIAAPLALLVIGAENAQAYGVLATAGYRPPIDAMTIASGVGGLVTAAFGGHNANIAGPMTAICASDDAGPDRSGRYVATVVNGVLFGLFGVFASVAVFLVSVLPRALVATVAGLAMCGVLIGAFREAFAPARFRLGAFAAVVIALSGITVAHISAPFWALVGGILVSTVAEPRDFERAQAPPPASSVV